MRRLSIKKDPEKKKEKPRRRKARAFFRIAIPAVISQLLTLKISCSDVTMHCNATGRRAQLSALKRERQNDVFLFVLLRCFFVRRRVFFPFLCEKRVRRFSRERRTPSREKTCPKKLSFLRCLSLFFVGGPFCSLSLLPRDPTRIFHIFLFDFSLASLFLFLSFVVVVVVAFFKGETPRPPSLSPQQAPPRACRGRLPLRPKLECIFFV